jgi:hypothetical protein
MKDAQIISESSSDELDLIVVVEKMVAFFNRFFYILIIFPTIGIIAGFVLFLSTPRKYTSELILHSYILTNLENIQIIENWRVLLTKKEYNTLAVIWNCNPNLIKKINKISTQEIQKLYVQDNPHGFIVQVTVKDTSILDDLQKGIVYGLENTDYVKQKLITKRANLIELIEKVKGEITKLDSTKQIVENILNNKNKSSSSLFVDITSINSGIINLNEKLLTFQEQLKFANAIQVLQNFNKFSHPEGRNGLLLLLVGAIIGLVIGYLTSLVLAVRQKLIERRK